MKKLQFATWGCICVSFSVSTPSLGVRRTRFV